jgi:hypothetical protein
MDNSDQGRGLSRHVMEIATACLTGGIGLVVCYGSWQLGIAWEETGPASGYFPFWIGVLITLGSLGNLGRALILKHHVGEVFLDRERLNRVAAFFLPVVAFAVLSVFVGLYIGTLLYIAAAMIFQGKYAWWISLLSGLGVAVAFYLIFEIGFQVPLLKGPVEAMFGIY